MDTDTRYHIGFGPHDIEGIDVAILCGDPARAERVARENLRFEKVLSTNRGLHSYIGTTPGGRRVVSATSGMGAPSTSIIVNELAQVGIRHIVRVGTTGSIQSHVRSGSVVITRAALCRQGAADDIAPREYPAAASPFWTMALADAARRLGVDWHVGLTASVDTFFEGQGRTETSYNPHLVPSRQGLVEAYRHLRILNYEMESGTLFKMANAYGLGAACVAAVIADRDEAESVALDVKEQAERDAIRVAVAAVDGIDPAWLGDAFRW